MSTFVHLLRTPDARYAIAAAVGWLIICEHPYESEIDCGAQTDDGDSIVFRGTLIFDEADFRFRDERSEILRLTAHGNRSATLF
jgi:hypothetical protein